MTGVQTCALPIFDDHDNFDFVLDTTSLSYKEVFEKVSPFVEGNVLDWLENAVKAI